MPPTRVVPAQSQRIGTCLWLCRRDRPSPGADTAAAQNRHRRWLWISWRPGLNAFISRRCRARFVSIPDAAQSRLLQLSVRVARAFKMWFSRTLLQMACPLQEHGWIHHHVITFLKGRGDTFRQASITLQKWGCCDTCCPCWEAGISISSDCQGGIKLLNGPSGFWLGLMTIILTIPVMSTACCISATLIIEGCISMLHPVIINPCSLQQHYFIINPRSLQQRYFQQC